MPNKIILFSVLATFAISMGCQAKAGEFQDSVYKSAEKFCSQMGKSRLENSTEWLDCMEKWIPASHTLALSEIGLAAPPYGSPEEVTERKCMDVEFRAILKVSSFDECYKKLLPMSRDADRNLWNQKSQFDR